jgi:hypothetical protein
MLSTLKSLFSSGNRRRPARRPDRKVRLSLESLESRMVPTILFTPHNGPDWLVGLPHGMQDPVVNVVFSGSYWSSTQGKDDVNGLVSATKTLLSGPYLSGLTQYGSDGTAAFGSSWTDATTLPESWSGGWRYAPEPTAVQNFLQKSMTTPPGGHDWQHAPIYVVVSDPDSSASDPGWNAAGTYTEGGPAGYSLDNIAMIWFGTMTNREAGTGSDSRICKDDFTEKLSQYLANTIANPAGYGVWVKTSYTHHGIADNEPAHPDFRYAYRLDGNMVQPYWSASDNAFIVPDGNTQNFSLNPWWCDPTLPYAIDVIDLGPPTDCTPGFHRTPDGRGPQYQLSVTGDQYGPGYNDRIDIAQTASGGVQVTLNGETACFDAGTIGPIYVDTGEGSNWVNVTGVPWGVALHINGGSGSNDAVTIGGWGSSGSLAGLAGFVDVRNDGGKTALFIDASNDPYTSSLRITDSAVGFGTRGPGVDYQAAFFRLEGDPYAGFEFGLHGVTSLTIRGSHNGSAVWVESVPLFTTITVYGTPWDIADGPAAGRVHFYLDWYFYYLAGYPRSPFA